MRRAAPWWVLAACALTAWASLRPGDVRFADVMWEQAHELALPADDPVWLDVAAAQRAVAPWQEGWSRARHRLATLEARRRARLPHDRGAWGGAEPPP